MPTLTVSATITFGTTDSTTGAVSSREPLSFELTYTEASIKTVQVAASASDQSVTLDSVTAPKFLFVQSLEGDVSVKLDDGVTTDPTPTAVAAEDGWVMIANANGQEINELLVTTPASPTTGARIKILAFE